MAEKEGGLIPVALLVLAGLSGPAGAWQLRRELAERGFAISEATSGRLLRLMEESGFVESQGRQGRVVTPLGRKFLDGWKAEERRKESQSGLAESLHIQHPEGLTDVLVARRAIEGETAMLAAANATPEDLARMERIIEEHREALTQGLSGTDQNTAFHMALAEASRNKVLLGALDVICQHPDVMQALEYIRSYVGSEMAEEHAAVLEAIRRRDPLGARDAMVRHITNVIGDVDAYRKTRGKQDGRRHSSD